MYPLFVNALRNQDEEHFNNIRPVNQFPMRLRRIQAGMRKIRSYIATSDGIRFRDFTFETF